MSNVNIFRMEKGTQESQSMAKKVKKAYRGSADKAVHADAPEGEFCANVESTEGVATAGEVEGSSQSRSVDDASSLMAELDRVTRELAEEKGKANDLQNRYLRLVADMENFRKRALKEREDLLKVANGNFAEDLFPVMDNFRLGLAAADSHPEALPVVEGFRMVFGQIGEVLKGKGIEEIAPTGGEFDPKFHECISHLPHPEIPENHVIQTVRKGYRMGDRLLRAASVVVSSGPVVG